MLQSLVAQFVACVMAAICLYALIAGTWRERFGAFILCTGYFLQLGFGVSSTDHIAAYLLVADVICLLGFYIACWKAQHPWPQWALLAQIVSVAVDIISLLNIGLGIKVFLIIQNLAGFGVLLALLIGTIAAAKARREARKPGQKKTALTPPTLTKTP